MSTSNNLIQSWDRGFRLIADLEKVVISPKGGNDPERLAKCQQLVAELWQVNAFQGWGLNSREEAFEKVQRWNPDRFEQMRYGFQLSTSIKDYNPFLAVSNTLCNDARRYLLASFDFSDPNKFEQNDLLMDLVKCCDLSITDCLKLSRKIHNRRRPISQDLINQVEQYIAEQERKLIQDKGLHVVFEEFFKHHREGENLIYLLNNNYIEWAKITIRKTSRKELCDFLLRFLSHYTVPYETFAKLICDLDSRNPTLLGLVLQYVISEFDESTQKLSEMAKQSEPEIANKAFLKIAENLFQNIKDLYFRHMPKQPPSMGIALTSFLQSVPGELLDQYKSEWNSLINQSLPFPDTEVYRKLNAHLNKILRKLINPHFKMELMARLVKFLEEIWREAGPQFERITEKKELVSLFVEVFKLPSGLVKDGLFFLLLPYFTDREKGKKWIEMTQGMPKRVLASGLLLYYLLNDSNKVRALLQSLSSARYKGDRVLATVNDALSSLNFPSQGDEMKRLLEIVLGAAGKETVPVNRISLIFAGFDDFKKCKDVTAVNRALHEYEKSIFNLKTDADEKRFNQNFCESKRYPNALLIYAARLQSLPEKQELNAALQRFVRAVLDDKFSETRYALDNNPHLYAISRDYPQLFEQWKTSLPIQSNKSASVSQITPQERVRKALLQAAGDKHMGEGSLLYHKDVKAGKIDPQQYPMESLFLELVTQDLPVDEIEEKLKQLKTLVPGQMQFSRDIEDILKALASKGAATSDFVVLDTDEWEDLLLLGTEVLQSCQHIMADVENNKCLLAYALDGKNRAIAVKDKTGKIIARSVLRLMLDEEAGKPVLLMERIYSDAQGNSLAQEMVKEGCLQKAKALGLPLVIGSYVKGAEQYKGKLTALGGPAPFEYSDAGHGIQPNGQFKVSCCQILYDPEAKS